MSSNQVASTSTQNIVPVQALFNSAGVFQTFVSQNQTFLPPVSPTQTGLTITSSTISTSTLSSNTLTNNTISGGTINGTTIGAVTPSTGVFTTISSSTSSVFLKSSLFKNLTGGDYLGISGAGGATQPILKISSNDAGQQISLNINSVDGTTGASLSINGITGQPKWTIDSYGNIFPSQGTTTQTNGLFYIPSCSGAPTGVPTVENAGITAMMYDETNNKLYAYNGGWKSVTLT
jgi:hypothetical protein